NRQQVEPSERRTQANIQQSQLRGVPGLKPGKVGICGLGTVGGGTINVLQRNAEETARRAGRAIEGTHIASRPPKHTCNIGSHVQVTDGALALVNNPEIDVIVELIGGYGLALEIVMQAIANGKHVVTANKALIAVHGNEIFTAAREKGVIVA